MIGMGLMGSGPCPRTPSIESIDPPNSGDQGASDGQRVPKKLPRSALAPSDGEGENILSSNPCLDTPRA